MRPIFAGNLEYDTRQSELERLFSKYGRIERLDMKSGKFLAFLCLVMYRNLDLTVVVSPVLMKSSNLFARMIVGILKMRSFFLSVLSNRGYSVAGVWLIVMPNCPL